MRGDPFIKKKDGAPPLPFFIVDVACDRTYVDTSFGSVAMLVQCVVAVLRDLLRLSWRHASVLVDALVGYKQHGRGPTAAEIVSSRALRGFEDRVL